MRKLLFASAILAAMTAPSQAFKIEILKPAVIASINISTQRMHVYVGGKKRYTWKVSTGASGHRTPTGTFTPYRRHRHYWSRQYDMAPMHYALFFHRGYAVHATDAIRTLGVPASYGCVRLHPANAAKLWSLVNKYGMARTRFKLRGDWRVAERNYRKRWTTRRVGRFVRQLSNFGN